MSHRLQPLARSLRRAWPMVDPERIEAAAMAEIALDASQAMTPDKARDLALFAHASMAALQRGEATEVDANNLALISNVALLLAEIGYGIEALPEIQAGQLAANGVRLRQLRTGRAVATGPELQALRELVDLHDQQLQLQPTGAQMTAVIAELRRRMADGEVM